mgnify:FL=1
MKAIDTSALVELLLNTERFAAASDYFDDELIATDLVIPESLNALRRIAMRHPRSARRVDRSVDILGQLPIDFVPLQALTDEIWQMRGSVMPYDAAHVAVARAAGCALLTADARLARSVPDGTSIILV